MFEKYFRVTKMNGCNEKWANYLTVNGVADNPHNI